MLRKETVSQSTLELLKELMSDEKFTAFFLVGGTALSLQIGHRISIDLDFFSGSPFDENELLPYLEMTYDFQTDFLSRNTLKGFINDVKIDFITHSYPLVNPLVVWEGVRMASLSDIAAMKFNSIIGNGTRVKDFTDIAYLSSELTLAQMAEAYETKYSFRNPVMLLKSLGYHQDIDFSEPIMMLDEQYDWANVSYRLSEMILEPDKLFPKRLGGTSL